MRPELRVHPHLIRIERIRELPVQPEADLEFVEDFDLGGPRTVVQDPDLAGPDGHPDAFHIVHVDGAGVGRLGEQLDAHQVHPGRDEPIPLREAALGPEGRAGL